MGKWVSRRLARIEERRLAGIGFRDLIMYSVRQERQTTAFNLFAVSNEQSPVWRPAPVLVEERRLAGIGFVNLFIKGFDCRFELLFKLPAQQLCINGNNDGA
jgi:hypothetical protein